MQIMYLNSASLIFALIVLLLFPKLSISGFVFISGDDSDDFGHCETASSCSGLIVDVFSECITSSNALAAQKDVLAIGIDNSYQSQAYVAFTNWQSYLGFTYDITNNINGWTYSDLSAYRMIFIPSDEYNTNGGISCATIDSLLSISSEIATYVNTIGGSLMTLVQGTCSSAYIWLPTKFQFRSISESSPVATTYLQAIVPALTSSTLFHCCYHIEFTGPVGFNGLNSLALNPNTGFPIIIGGLNVKLTNKICSDGTHADDPDCAETQCFDGIDNNVNGLTDCEDPNCQLLFSVCAPTASPTPLTLSPTYFPTPNPYDSRICQGILFIKNNTVVTCSQFRDFDQFPMYKGEMSNGTIPNQAQISVTTIPPSAVNDVSVNCALYGNVNYNFSVLLPIHGLFSGPDHNFVMLQQFALPSSIISNKTKVYSAMLFMKGATGGQGRASVASATSDWVSLSSRQMCPVHSPIDRMDVAPASASGLGGGYDIFPRDTLQQLYELAFCSSHLSVVVNHVVGWVQVNVTDLLHCQLASGSASLNLMWTQSDDEIEGQIWYSSQSIDNSPYLVLYSLLS